MSNHDDPEQLARKAELRERMWRALQDVGAVNHGQSEPGLAAVAGPPARARGPFDLVVVERVALARTGRGQECAGHVRRMHDESEGVIWQGADRRRCSASSRIGNAARGVVGPSGAASDVFSALLGKGGGFSDLEFAVAAEAGMVDNDTMVATTVHEIQLVGTDEVPVSDHDIRVDLIVTPERIIETPGRDRRKRVAVRWDELTEDKIAAIPLLQRWRGGH